MFFLNDDGFRLKFLFFLNRVNYILMKNLKIKLNNKAVGDRSDRSMLSASVASRPKPLSKREIRRIEI